MGLFSRMFLGGKSRGSVGIEKSLRLFGRKVKKIHVTVRNLTPWDLRSSKFPEDDYNIWVNVGISEGVNYRLIYSNCDEDSICNRKYYPRVGLSSSDVSMKDFNEMLTYVTDVNQGREIERRPTIAEYSKVSALVHEDRIPFTQKFIADMVDKYASRFESVSIPVAYFRVPKAALDFPGFSQDKLEIDKLLG